MLSPASLRVCCLAVMAPALTKADRRAECLPVAFPFCVSKTAAPENRKDRNDITLSKLPNKFACLLNKRKPLVHKAWFRTYIRSSPDISDKTRISAFDLRKSVLNNKVKVNAETKYKTWHGTNVTLAVADKVRLKYTMNKNTSAIKNMGLARANTSPGLHTMKRINKVTQLTHRDKGNSSGLTLESGESSPDLPDSTNSELETFNVVRIVQSSPEQLAGEVTSSGDDVTCSNSNYKSVPSVESDTALPIHATANFGMLDTCNDALSPDVDISAISRDSDLPVSITDPECLLDVAKCPENVSKDQYSNPLESDLPQSCAKSSTSEDACKVASLPPTSAIPVDDILDVSSVGLHDISCHFISPPPPACNVPVDVNTTEILPSTEESPLSLGSPLSPVSVKDSDIETLSANCSFSSSSTISADASPLLSSFDEGGDTVFVLLPGSKTPTELSGPVYSFVSSPKSHQESPVLHEDMRITRYSCCPVPDRDVSSLKELLIEHEKRLSAALDETEVLLSRYMVPHVQKEIRTLVERYQTKLTVPCQKRAKLGSFKQMKDIVDLKAELLQSEDVKNLSTAALVNFVRKLESTTSSGALLLPQNAASELPSNTPATFSPEDYADVKHTSKILLTGMKRVLKCADPDLTESSEDESSDAETEESAEVSFQKKALWKFMKERAVLTSRSTWLIARIHELENQLRTITGILKKVTSSVGEVRLKDATESSASSTAGSGDASSSIPLPTKQSRPKGLGKPVNGYLDHGSSTSSKNAVQTLESLHLEQKVSEASESCSRTRALDTASFRKRKLLITTGLHLSNSKLAKLSTVGCVCNCQDEMMPCVLCTGRYNCVQTVDPDSMPLLDRVALLDPCFHPLLSFEKDVPLLLHFENILKKNEAQYQTIRSASPVSSHRKMHFGTKPKHYSDARSRSRKLNRCARSLLSAKYRSKKHFRKRKLVFGKWRKFHTKNSFQARDRIRRFSVASSGSSHDSPVPSPLSAYDDGSGYDLKRRRDDNQFDIDDVIIPYSNKRGRLVKFEFKDIEIPSWRSKAFGNLESIDIEEDTSEAAFIKRHEGYEIEERKIIRNGGGALCFFNTWQRRARRHHRSDSRADSSGANTPDPVLLCDQDMFQDPNSLLATEPLLPVLSPLGSVNPASDDSQTAFSTRLERRRAVGAKRPEEVSSSSDFDDVPPYEALTFPLSDETLQGLRAECDYNRDDTDATASGPSCPASPESTTTTIEEEDVTDPEWTVVKRESGSEQPLVLKFAKR